MQIIRQNVGVDVDSAELKISFQVLQEDLTTKVIDSGTFKNTPAGFKALMKRINRKRIADLPLHFTMEVTGVYHENFAYFLIENDNVIVHIELPNKTAAYKKSLNLKSKTDVIDAAMLGQLGAERTLEKWSPGSAQMRKIKKLSRERLRILKEKTMVCNQLHAETSSFDASKSSIKRYKQRITFLDKQVAQIEKELEQMVTKDKELEQKIENVCTIKGVAFITVIGIVAETDGFALFKNRNQLVSYAGYDVVERESGTSIKGKTKISKKGNSYIRQIMYMPSMSAVRHDEHHKTYYKRIVQKRGIKMKASVAIQRKLLLLIYALFTKNEPYDEKYAERLKKKLEPKQIENV
jgi:transposase